MKKDCKNCIHDEICPVWDDYNDEPCKDGCRGFCNNYDKFKDKSQFSFNDVGTKIFLTKEEAEEKLKELNENE